MRSYRAGTVGLALLLMLGVGGSARAATDERCFPETNQCISRRFRQFWEQNGGLPVFGYPITPARGELSRDDGKSYLAQWFERHRFEYHPENQPPYDVLLGRLGAERAADADPPIDRQREDGAKPGCLWFEATELNVCDNQGASFASFWRAHGLADPALNAYQRSLALFGLPISRQAPAEPAGEVAYVQYFERARFEWHPGNAEPYNVLLGRLGAEASPPASGSAQLSAAFDDTGTPVDLLASFYNAINRQEYRRAYGYWETPPSGYDDFARGYADTAGVLLIVQPPAAVGAAAGSAYASIPTALVATRRDGSQQIFSGCYVARRSNLRPPDIPREDVWHLYSATIGPQPAGSAIPALLAKACPANR